MTQDLTVSIVIVSRHRPKALRRCLLGISQLSYQLFEIVIVADPDTCAGLRSVPQAAHAKIHAFDDPNISAARNHGIRLAAGDIVAFIDDDSVPEYSWLTHLVAPFRDPTVMATGGYVLGRNGISWQSRAKTVDRAGRDAAIDIPDGRATVLTPTPDRAIKTEGTNMAFRRVPLAQIGGFDDRFRFFLDETDLNWRIGLIGWSTALVPNAVVHHGYLESARRRADRVPTNLTDVGASWGLFLNAYCHKDDIPTRWSDIQNNERARLLRHMVSGALEPGDVGRLMHSLQQGYYSKANLFDNQKGSSMRPGPIETGSEPFSPCPGTNSDRSDVLAGRIWSLSKLRKQATGIAGSGHRVSLFCFSHTALYHRVRFTDQGYWEQTGGLFGRSLRDQPVFQFWTFSKRLNFEMKRIKVMTSDG